MKQNPVITTKRSWPAITETYEIIDGTDLSYTRKTFLGFSRKAMPLLLINPYFEERKSIAIAEIIWSFVLVISMLTLSLTELVSGENKVLTLIILVILLPFAIAFINAAISRSQHSYIFRTHCHEPDKLSLPANHPSPEESFHFAQALANAIKSRRMEDDGQSV